MPNIEQFVVSLDFVIGYSSSSAFLPLSNARLLVPNIEEFVVTLELSV